MKNATQCAKKLKALLRKLPEPPPTEFDDEDDPVAVLIQSFLMADATTEKAQTAYRRLLQRVTDFNDVRVSMPHELVEYIGARYPGALERCQLLRRTLRGVYLREHAVTLDRLKTAGKREVKTYLENLDGIPPYVAARVMVTCFDAHAVPVDEQLRAELIAAGAADESADLSEVSVWLARQIKASDRITVHRKLQAWIDASGGRPARGRSRGAGRGAASSRSGRGDTAAKGASRSKNRGSRGTRSPRTAV